MKSRIGDWWYLRLALALGDAVTVLAASWVATDFRPKDEFSLFHGIQPLVALALTAGALALFAWHRLYDEEYLLAGTQEYSRAARACTYGTLAVVALSFFAGGSQIVSRGWLLSYWGLSSVGICLWRFLARRLVERFRERGRLITRLIVAGASDQGTAIAEQLDAPVAHGTEVVGFVDDYLPVGTIVTTTRHTSPHALPVLGDPTALPRITREHEVREVIVVPQALTWESLQAIVSNVALGDHSYRVRLAPGFYDVLATGVRPTPRGHVPLLAMEKARITGVDRVLKKLLDLTACLAVLPVLVPALVILTLVGRLRGKHPIFEVRRILGIGGCPQTVWFFGPWLAHHRLLRGLPALLSVLRGQLSLVGPRPNVAATSHLDAGTSGNLLVVKPGLTGLWRLVAPRLAQPPSYHDLWYVRNYTIWEDLRILYRTIWRLWPTANNKAVRLNRWQPEAPRMESLARVLPGSTS